jgi:hypothetical protein
MYGVFSLVNLVSIIVTQGFKVMRLIPSEFTIRVYTLWQFCRVFEPQNRTNLAEG